MSAPPATRKPIQRSIILFGTWAEENLGDDYMLCSLIREIRDHDPDVRLVLFTGDRAITSNLLDREGLMNEHVVLLYTGRKGLREPKLPFFSSVAWFFQNVAEIFRADFLLIGPGNQLQDVTRRMRVLFFISRGVLAWLFRTPYAYFGIGYYQIHSRFCRWVFQKNANGAAFVSTRDEVGAKTIRKLGVKGTGVHGLADVTFSYPWPERKQQTKTDRQPVIGFTYRVFLPPVFEQEVVENLEHCLAGLLTDVQTGMNARFRFFPFYKASKWNDRVGLSQLKKRLPPDFPVEIAEWHTLSGLRSQMMACDGFIGVRYHSVLLSVQSGIPVMGISYAHKTRRFMEENGLSDFLVDVEDITEAKLRDQWSRLWTERYSLSGRYAEIRLRKADLARRHTQLLFNKLKSR